MISMQMPSVNPKQNFENVLCYAMKNKKGNIKDLENIDKRKNQAINQLTSGGIIKVLKKRDAELYYLTKKGTEFGKNFLNGFRNETPTLNIIG